MVLRAMSWPRLCSALQIRVVPQVGQLRAISTTSKGIDCLVRGRPGPRLAEPSQPGGDEPSVPSKQRVARHDGPELLEAVATDGLGLFRKATTLLIGPADGVWAELLSQSAVFGLEVVDHPLLAAVHPAGEHQDEQLEVEVHARGDERQLGSGGKFQRLGEADLDNADAA